MSYRGGQKFIGIEAIDVLVKEALTYSSPFFPGHVSLLHGLYSDLRSGGHWPYIGEGRLPISTRERQKPRAGSALVYQVDPRPSAPFANKL